MKAELIAVGTEILLGNIVNTDAQVLSQGLSELGIDVYYQTVVGDNPVRLESVIRQAAERADIIITTGGLGPTLDDLTKETLAKVFGKKLVFHEESYARIEEYFKRLEKPMAENNRKQAMLPEGCIVFRNDWGTAPGCAFRAGGNHVLMLPGPPRECNPMFLNCAMPYLRALTGGCIVSHSVRVFGMPESMMESILHDKMAVMTNPTIAPYAKTGECFVRVTAKAETEAAAEALCAPAVREVCETLGEAVYGVDVDSLEQVVGHLLQERGMTLAVAESCTGGLLSKRITDVSGSSGYYLGGVCSYATEIKSKVLDVDAELLAKNGPYDPQVAEQMAQGIARLMGADVGIGITGLAGPGGGTEEKPVGLVYIAVSILGKTVLKTLHYRMDRERIRLQAASTALNMLRVELQRKSKFM